VRKGIVEGDVTMKTIEMLTDGCVTIGRWSMPVQPHKPKDLSVWIEKVKNLPDPEYPQGAQHDICYNDGTYNPKKLAIFIANYLKSNGLSARVEMIRRNEYEVAPEVEVWGCECEFCKKQDTW